jgi:hypothetical protein
MAHRIRGICRFRSWHTWTLLVEPGYDRRRLYRCPECWVVTDSRERYDRELRAGVVGGAKGGAAATTATSTNAATAAGLLRPATGANAAATDLWALIIY